MEEKLSDEVRSPQWNRYVFHGCREGEGEGVVDRRFMRSDDHPLANNFRSDDA